MKFKNPLMLVFLSWLVAALTILGVAFVISPDTYIGGFWGRVAWTGILNALFWIGGSGWFVDEKENSRMAITPVTSFLTSLYCVISFVLMLAFYHDESVYGLNNAHVVIQIVLLGVYAVLALRLQLAVHFADKDLIISQTAAISPQDLCQKIKNTEKTCAKDVAKELKKLREKIMYSLQDNNRVRTNEQYKKLVKDLTAKINEKRISGKEISDFVVTVEDLAHAIKRV